MEPEVTRKLEEDVSFVRQAVEQRDKAEYKSLAIIVMWAVIVAVGYALNDFAMDYVPFYWMTAPVAGFLVSLALGSRSDRKRGLSRPGLSARHGLHWGTIFLGGMAAISIAVAHRFDGWVIGQPLRPPHRRGVLPGRSPPRPAHPLAGGPAHLRGRRRRPHPAIPVDHRRPGHRRDPGGQRPVDEAEG